MPFNKIQCNSLQYSNSESHLMQVHASHALQHNRFNAIQCASIQSNAIQANALQCAVMRRTAGHALQRNVMQFTSTQHNQL